MSKKIGFFGNCHTLALSWFFRKIHPNLENKWIRSERWKSAPWSLGMLYKGGENPHEHIIDEGSNLEIDYIKSCDMFVHTVHKYKNYLSTDMISGLLPDHCVQVMMPTVIVKHDTNKIGKFISTMEKGYDDKFDVSFKDLILSDKAEMLDENHPNSYLFLEMVNTVCKELGLDGIPEDQYQPFLDFGWPFDNWPWLKARKVMKNDAMRNDLK